MVEPDQPYSPELGDYLSALRRRWWLVPLAAVGGLLLGAAYAELAPKTFTASASVYVTATGTTSNQVANSRTSGTVNLDSEAQVAQSAQVSAIAAKLMHSSLSPQALVKQINISVPANSQVLVISCQAGTKDGVAICAQSFARAYLQYSSTTATQTLKNQISALQDRVNGLQKQYGKLSTAVASLPLNSPQRGDDESLLSVAKTQLNQYSNQLVTLSAELADSSGGYIISDAVPPGKPTSPNKPLALAGGLIVGLLAGLIGAFWWGRLDRRIRDPRDVTRLGLPILPAFPPKARSRPTVDMALAGSAEGKAFNRLAYAVAAALGEGNVVLVAGTSSGTAGSYVAANLAAGLARTHRDSTLVCANLQGSVAPRISGITAQPGLAELMNGDLSAGEVILPDPGVPRLFMITPGIDGVAESAIQQDVISRLLSVLRREARFIVIEAPPLAEAADVYALSALADAAVVATEAGRDLRADLRIGTQRLEQLGISLLGVVPLPALRGTSGQMYAEPDGDAEYDDDDEYEDDDDEEYADETVKYPATEDSAGPTEEAIQASEYTSGSRAASGEDTVVSHIPSFPMESRENGPPAGEQDRSQPGATSGPRAAGPLRRR